MHCLGHHKSRAVHATCDSYRAENKADFSPRLSRRGLPHWRQPCNSSVPPALTPIQAALGEGSSSAPQAASRVCFMHDCPSWLELKSVALILFGNGRSRSQLFPNEDHD